MPISSTDVVKVCSIVAEQEDINVCVTESLKGAGIAGVSAFTLGVIFGPVGLAVGGAAGGLAGAKLCKKYEPLWKILAMMRKEDKERLYTHMIAIIEKLDITDAAVLLALVTNKGVGYRNVVDGVMLFAQQMSR